MLFIIFFFDIYYFCLCYLLFINPIILGDGMSEDDGDLKEALGAHDCVLVGNSFELMAHKNVLKHRCEHFKAR